MPVLARKATLLPLLAAVFACLLASLAAAPSARAAQFSVLQCENSSQGGTSNATNTFVFNDSGTGSLGYGHNCPSNFPWRNIRGTDGFGDNAGIWITSCSNSAACYTTNTNADRYKEFVTSAPGGAYLSNFNLSWTSQTSTPQTSGGFYEWLTQILVDRREGGTNVISSGLDNNSVLQNVSCQSQLSSDCNSRFGGAGSNWGNATLTGNASQTAANVKFRVTCKPVAPSTQCTATYAPLGYANRVCLTDADTTSLPINDYRCQVRMNVRTAGWIVVDEQNPSLSASDNSGLWSAGWVSGVNGNPATRSLNFNAGDNTGILRSLLFIDGNLIDDTNYRATECWKGDDSWPNAQYTYLNNTPCPLAKASTKSADISGLGTGAHTVTVQVYDVSGLNTSVSNTLYVDHQDPGPGTGCGGLNLTDPAPYNGIAGDGRRYVKGNNVVATGTACDPTTGSGTLASSYLQYQINGGAWTACGNSGTLAAPRCVFDSTPYAEGTTVRWRVVAQDIVGNIGYGSAGNTFYIDNTANQIAAGGLTMVGYSGTAGRTDADNNTCTTVNMSTVGVIPSCVNLTTNQWTNKRTVRVKWNAASAGAGSPIVKYRYRYNNGCTTTADADVPGGAAARYIDVTNQDNPTSEDDCSQGTHTVIVWPVDHTDNENGTSPPAQQTTFRYDSVAPDAVTNMTVTPKTWTNQRTFQINWTNSRNPKNAATSATKTSPFAQARYRLADATPQVFTGCLGSLSNCGPQSVTIPSSRAGGAYPLKLWLRDEAGNQNETLGFANVTLYYNDDICLR